MNKVLIGILVLSFFLRVVGINYGLPLQLVGDEASLIGGALKMLETHTLIPALQPDEFRLLYYPPVMSYIYLASFLPYLAFKFVASGGSLAIVKSQVALDPSSIWLIARFVTALLGVLLVYLIYLVGRRMFDARSGMFVAGLVATSFLAVQLSHFARHWMPATFFATLVITLGLFIYLRPERKAYLFAGVLGGVAFGVSYITAIAMFVPIACHFLSPHIRSFKRPHVQWLVMMLLLFAAVAALAGWLNLPELRRITLGEDSTLQTTKTLLGWLQALSGAAIQFFHSDPILVLAALLGLIFMGMKFQRLALIFFGFPILYWSVLYFFFHFEPRYNTLLVPWFALLAGYFLDLLFASARTMLSRVAIVVVLLGLPATASIYYDTLLLRADTRSEAITWVNAHVRSGARIVLYAPTIKLSMTRASALHLLDQYPYAARTQDRALATLMEQNIPDPAYDVVNLRMLTAQDQQGILAGLKSGTYEYLVVEAGGNEPLPSEILQALIFGNRVAIFVDPDAHPDNALSEASVFQMLVRSKLGPEIVIIKL